MYCFERTMAYLVSSSNFPRTPQSISLLLFTLVCTLALTGCGGGGGSPADPPTLDPERGSLMSTLTVAPQIENAAATSVSVAAGTIPRELLSSSGNSGTSQISRRNSEGAGRNRTILNARYNSDGELHFAGYRTMPGGIAQVANTEDEEASFNRLENTPAAGWGGVEFTGNYDSYLIYAEAFSDIENDADTDYLVMGYWVTATQNTTEVTGIDQVGVAGSGSDPFEANNLAGLTGTATYEGPATGLHMTKENPAANPAFDYFNAKASLAADFSDASAPGSISGTVTEGMTGGGVVLPELTLEAADINADTYPGGFFDGATGGNGISGSWGGKFYGNGASAADNPGSVAGTFGATTADGLQSFIGAFGAHKQ